jgi:MFS family permease
VAVTASAAPRPLLTRAFLLLCLATSLGALAPNLFLVTPAHLGTLRFREGEIGAIMGASSLASLVMMPFVAHFADRFGRRAPLIVGLVCMAAGCLAFSYPTGLAPLMALRILQGVGWAGVLVGGSLFVTELAPEGRLAQALGVAGVLTLVAIAAGPMCGELLVRHAGYAWMCRAAAAVALAGAAVTAILPEPAHSRPRASGPLLAWSPGTRRPLAAAFLVAIGFGAVISFLSDYMRRTGVGTITPFFDAYVAVAILTRLTLGRLSDRLGRHSIIVPALCGHALALGGLAFVRSAWHLVPLGLAYGLTHGLYYPALQALVVERAPDTIRSRAIATFNFAFSAGVAASSFGNGQLARYTSYAWVYALSGALAVASAALCWSHRQ